jgi:hypothetical protein
MTLRSVRSLVRGLSAALAGLALLPLAAPPARADIQINPQGWRFPNVITANKEMIKVVDRTSEIPGEETMLKGYRKADGTAFMTYEIEGKVFGVEIDEDGHAPFEASILDTDGDGKFETRIPHTKGNQDRAYVPKWVIDHYFEVHPEVPRGPGGHAPSPALRPAPPAAPGASKPPVPKAPPPMPPPERPNP